ncbi:MAG: flagellar protein FlbB [Spirochaetia bacterium]
MYNDQGFGHERAWPRIFGLTLLVVILGVGGALWFDFLGLVDVTGFFAPALRWVGLEPREAVVLADDPLLLEGSRLEKREEALALREDELTQRGADVEAREAELQLLANQLEALEVELEDRENSVTERLRQVENERAALVKLSGYLTNMPPADAVAQMVNYSDDLLLNVLLVTDELAEESGQASLVPFWLSQLPADLAAAVGERLSLLPEIEGAN